MLLLTSGFSVGDELGFSQSLSNVEAAKRRSVQTNRVGSLSHTNLVRISETLEIRCIHLFFYTYSYRLLS